MDTLLAFSDGLAAAVETGSRSLVAVNGRPYVPSSGILWRDGVVVTTHHTLKREQGLTVTLPDGRTIAATVAGRDQASDLAVLRLEENASAPEVGIAASLRPGHLVLALGRRAGNGVTAGLGVVSAVIDDYLRPEIGIFTGFSGGALVDVAGRVIGINTTGLTRGSAVTIPAASVSRVVDELLERGHVRRGFLGVGFHPIETGLIILSLEKDGPAARAGVLVGDVLVALDGKPVSDTDDVQAHLGSGSVGRAVRAEFVRGGQRVTLEITPEERQSRK